jgi:ribonucleoside-diphosphate reductase alpha chain
MTYSHEEAMNASMAYFNQDSLASNVFVGKYALRNEKGELLESNPEQMHRRLAKEFARIEAKYPNPLSEEEIFSLFKNFKYCSPQGSPCAGIGNPYQVTSLSNCFVVETGDSYGWISNADQELIHTFRRRGGCGLDLSPIRPKGMVTANAAKTTDGIGIFMERFSNTCREVAQCLHKDTLILTKNGLKPISEIKEKEDFVWTNDSWVKVEKVLKNKKHVVKLSTKNGNEILCSKDHVFHTINGELSVQNFEINSPITQIVGHGWEGEDIVLNNLTTKKHFNTNSKITLPNTMTKEFAYVVGQLYGDGCVKKNHLEIALSRDWPQIQDKLYTHVKQLFNYDAKLRFDKNVKCNRFNLNSVAIVEFLKNNLILKEKSDEIKFPEMFLKSKPEILFGFISGFFDADGHVNVPFKKYSMSSISEKFMRVLQCVLLSFGISSKIVSTERSKQNRKTLYTISINGQKSQELFKNLMIESEKIKYVGNFTKNKVRDWTKTVYKNIDFIVNSKNPNDFMSYTRVSKFLKQANLIQDSIKTIQPQLNIEVVYDLVLAKEHLFFANGLYAHNSGRRGALMETISIHHPEVETFIKIKKDKTKVTGANISVRLSNEFMNAVKENRDYEQRWPVDSIKPKVSKMIPAKKIWDLIMESARNDSEPGILFWDNIIENSPADSYPEFKTVSTNPCAELPLDVGGACRLLVINSLSYVINPFTLESCFDWELFKNHSQKAQRLMDDLVDLEIEAIDKILLKVNQDPEPEHIKQIEINLWNRIKDKCIKSRRTGLGPTAIGDTIAALGMRYGNDDSIEFVGKLYKTLALSSYHSSVNMAKERGAFPVFDLNLEKSNKYLNRLWETDSKLFEEYKKHGRRNVANLTTAPVGSLSLLMQVSEGVFGTTSGIECAYMPSYTRRKKIGSENETVDFVDELGDKWHEYKVYHPAFGVWMKITGKTENELKESPYFKATSLEIDWVQGTKLQAAAQKFIDHSISRTQNLPNDVTKETVGEIYMSAWEHGCKGYTVYRDGSRDGVLITKKSNNNQETIVPHHAPRRKKELECDIHHATINGEKWTIFVGLLGKTPYEVIGGLAKYVSIPKRVKSGKIVKVNGTVVPARYDLHYDYENPEEETVIKDIGNVFENSTQETFTRTISLSLRHGVPIQYIVEQLQKDNGKDSDLFSFNKGMGRVLKKYIVDGTKASQKTCDGCGGTELIYKEGCVSCLVCGWSKCS